MFGVAEDLDLSGLVGRTLRQLAVGAERIELGFDEEWRITIECCWRLENAGKVIATGGRGQMLDEVEPLRKRVGSTITEADVRAPDRICLHFSDGHELILIDDSQILESFSIDPAGIVV